KGEGKAVALFPPPLRGRVGSELLVRMEALPPVRRLLRLRRALRSRPPPLTPPHKGEGKAGTLFPPPLRGRAGRGGAKSELLVRVEALRPLRRSILLRRALRSRPPPLTPPRKGEGKPAGGFRTTSPISRAPFAPRGCRSGRGRCSTRSTPSK